MRSFQFVSATTLALTLAACSGGGSGGVKAPRNVSHKAESCPSINGEFNASGSTPERRVYKTILTEKTPTGLRLTDTQSVFEIDGKIHTSPDITEKGVTYRGSCANSTITLDGLQNGKSIARFQYSLNEAGDLVVVTTSFDARVQERGAQVWTKN
ncbi:MAG: hypothetical protein KF799_04045 [Bdellovibrionales bacterium]|nr:hypothetical protein [Bdellovibrionales bacterium]